MSEQVRNASNQTLAKHGLAMEVNHLLNLRSIADSHGVKDWRGKFEGIPAVIIGAGPSLDQAMPHLKGLEDRALMVACDRALKPLMAHGIEPHVTVSADMEPVLLELYSGIDIPKRLILLYDRDAYHPLVRDWRGPRLAYDTYFDLAIWSRMFTGVKGFMHKNLSVSHTGFYLAALAGCSPIMLVGVDCAFPTMTTHAAGVAPVDGGAIDPADPTWITIEDVHGNPVRSSKGFSAFARAFEDALVEQKATLFQTSPIGAKIKGAPHVPLEEAVKVHCQKTWDIRSILGDCLSAPRLPFDEENFHRHREHLIPQIDTIVKTCQRGISALKEAERIDRHKHPTRFREKIIRADLFRAELSKNQYLQYLLGKMLYQIVYLCEQMNEKIKQLAPLDPERLWVEAGKLELLFVQSANAAQTFRSCLETVAAAEKVSV